MEEEDDVVDDETESEASHGFRMEGEAGGVGGDGAMYAMLQYGGAGDDGGSRMEAGRYCLGPVRSPRTQGN